MIHSLLQDRFIIVHHVVCFGFSITFSVIGHFRVGHSVEMESGGP